MLGVSFNAIDSCLALLLKWFFKTEVFRQFKSLFGFVPKKYWLNVTPRFRSFFQNSMSKFEKK